MPTISMFYGILVLMYFRDNRRHHLPHIHVRYQGEEAAISIDDGSVFDGRLPPKQLKMVQACKHGLRFIRKICLLTGSWPSTVRNLSELRRFSERLPMLIDVISVRVLPEFQLDLEFKNGERRKFDMRPLLSMKPWNRVATPVLFERVRVDYGTVVWPGEIDVAPETLYEDSVPLI